MLYSWNEDIYTIYLEGTYKDFPSNYLFENDIITCDSNNFVFRLDRKNVYNFKGLNQNNEIKMQIKIKIMKLWFLDKIIFN